MSCEEGVSYVSTSTIRPASSHRSSETTGIELTAWDLRLLSSQYIQKGLLFTKPAASNQSDEQEEINIMISHLKTSLSHTLDHFFPLAGRLAITKHDDNDGTISVYINCNSAGAEFIHAFTDIIIADILESTYVPNIVYSMFPLNGVIDFEGQTQPLLSVQVTELIDGILIGCSINHTICDGKSFWHFFNSWSEVSRSGCDTLNHISNPPILKRWFPNNTNCPIRLPFSAALMLENYTSPSLPYQVVGRVFHFTSENIEKLKVKANLESHDEADESMNSSLHALLAHFWLAITSARHLDPNEESSYQFVIESRTKLNPPLPKYYFGNSVQAVVATAKVGELLERGIEWGALLLNKVVKSHNDAAIRRSLLSWMEKPEMLRVRNGSVSSLVTVSSPKFNIYSNDFGWGPPIALRSGASNQVDGKITIFAGPVEGSIDIEACFYLETLKAMENDSEFMEAVIVSPHFQSV